jgi:hypothetical protein
MACYHIAVSALPGRIHFVYISVYSVMSLVTFKYPPTSIMNQSLNCNY